MSTKALLNSYFMHQVTKKRHLLFPCDLQCNYVNGISIVLLQKVDIFAFYDICVVTLQKLFALQEILAND